MSGLLERRVIHNCPVPVLPPAERNGHFRFRCECEAHWESQMGLWRCIFRPEVWEPVEIRVPAPSEEESP